MLVQPSLCLSSWISGLGPVGCCSPVCFPGLHIKEVQPWRRFHLLSLHLIPFFPWHWGSHSERDAASQPGQDEASSLPTCSTITFFFFLVVNYFVCISSVGYEEKKSVKSFTYLQNLLCIQIHKSLGRQTWTGRFGFSSVRMYVMDATAWKTGLGSKSVIFQSFWRINLIP